MLGSLLSACRRAASSACALTIVTTIAASAQSASAQEAVNGLCAIKRSYTSGFFSSTQEKITLQDGSERSYTIRVPKNYDGTHALPMVIMLHGHGMTAGNEALVDLIGSKSYSRGFIAIYPQASKGGEGQPNWNFLAPNQQSLVPQLFGTATPPNDVQFIDELVDKLKNEKLCVDPERIYLAGHSAGAAFASLLACSSKHAFAGVAMVSATPAPHPTCNPDHVLPTISFHGTKDGIVPYDDPNGKVGPTTIPAPRAPLTVRDWATHNGCSTVATTLPTVTSIASYVRTRYADCPPGLESVLYTINNGGHGWPGGALTVFSYFGAADFGGAPGVPASDMILDFFAAH